MTGGVGDTVRGAVELTRPANSIAAGVLTFIGAFVAGEIAAAPFRVGAAVGSTVFATAAGMAINDYFDREIDRINRPDRAIPRGAISPRGALAFSLALFVASVVLALTLPALAIAIAVVNFIALVAYTELFKGLPGVGNVVVGYLGGSTFLFGGAAVGSAEPVVVLFALAALSTISREVIKDIEDVEGDRAEGLNTLPIAIGERRAWLVAVALLAVAVLASPVPYLLGYFGAAYLVVVLPAVVLMVVAAAEGRTDPTAGQKRLKYGQFLAALAFVVGRLAVEAGGIG